MALQVQALDLDEATLSGGAQLASSGGGLPARITTETNKVLEIFSSDNGGGVIFDPDNAHIWVTDNTTSLRKVAIADGSTAQTVVLASAGAGLFRFDGLIFYVSTAGSVVYSVDFATGTPTSISCPVSNQAKCIRVPGTTDLLWVKGGGVSGSGQISEFTISTGVATGRTLGGAGSWDMWALGSSIYYTDGITIEKVAEADLASEETWTRLGQSFSSAGYGDGLRAFTLDPDGKPLWRDNAGYVDRWTTAGALDQRVLWNAPELGSTGESPSTRYYRPFLAFSDDGRYLAFRAYPAAADGNKAIHVVNVQDQRARFEWTPGAAVTLESFLIPGCFSNERGTVVGTAYDFRKIRFYYSLDGGGTPVEFTPGQPDLDVAISAVQTLTIDVDMNVWEKTPGPDPYVGGDAGEGITIIYDDGIAAEPPADPVTPAPPSVIGVGSGGYGFTLD